MAKMPDDKWTRSPWLIELVVDANIYTSVASSVTIAIAEIHNQVHTG